MPGPKRQNVFLVPFSSTSTISRFGESFRGGQYNLVSLLFAVLLLMVPPYPTICTSGDRARAPVPYGVGTTAMGFWAGGRKFPV